MYRSLIVALLLLLTLPAYGQTLGTGVAKITFANCPSDGVTDATACLSAALSGGGHIIIPGGVYRVTNALNVTNGQCLSGSGRGLTTIAVAADFNATATGVIVMSGTEQQGPCVDGLTISFAQPQGQASRAAFATLAAGCTTGTGGTGCKYPPAINFGTSNRFSVKNVSVYAAWDGFAGTQTAGFFLENIEMGALDIGLALGGGMDFGHIAHWHSWPFGITSSLYTGVYGDGAMIAAQIGEVDGINVVDFANFEGRVQLTSAFSWGQFANVEMDGNNATFEIANSTPTGVSISNLYSTGASSGANSNCQLNITGGHVSVTNLRQVTSTTPGVCMSNGAVNIVGGYQNPNLPGTKSISHTGGILTVSGVQFEPYVPAGPWTVPVVSSTGNLVFVGNTFLAGSAGDAGAVVIATDLATNTVSGNNFNGWGFSGPGAAVLGTYSPNGPLAWQPPILQVGMSGAQETAVAISSAAGHQRELQFETSSNLRWRLITTPTAESGGNAGSDFLIQAFADNGTTAIGNPIGINRATLAVTIGADMLFSALPTSCAGKPTGTIWKNVAVLTVCP